MSENKKNELECQLATELAALLLNEGWVVQRFFEENPQWQCDIEFAEVDGEHLRIGCEGFGRDYVAFGVFFGPASFATVEIIGTHCWHTLKFLWIENGEPGALTVTNSKLRRQDQTKCTERAALKLYKVFTAVDDYKNVEA